MNVNKKNLLDLKKPFRINIHYYSKTYYQKELDKAIKETQKKFLEDFRIFCKFKLKKSKIEGDYRILNQEDYNYFIKQSLGEKTE